MSALIFVAVALAWAVYLIPQALRHRGTTDLVADDSGAGHGSPRRARVLASREPVDKDHARLVVPGRPATAVEASVPLPAARATRTVDPRARRTAAQAAAGRRRRVLSFLLVCFIAVLLVASFRVIGWAWVAVPAGLVVAWLVVCRLAVRRGHAAAAAVVRPGQRSEVVATPAAAPEPAPVAVDLPDVEDGPVTEEVPVVQADVADAALTDDAPAAAPAPGSWAPVAEVLPTYVDKAPAARRKVRTIDLDSTGVWTSGPVASDSALAREADEAHRLHREQVAAREAAEATRRRAAGS